MAIGDRFTDTRVKKEKIPEKTINVMKRPPNSGVEYSRDTPIVNHVAK